MRGASNPQASKPVATDTRKDPILSLSIPTPIGRIYLAASERGLVRIELPGPNAELRMNVWVALHFPFASIRCGVSPILRKATSQLEAYFTAGLTEFSLPLHFAGTPFQLDVWNEIARIPFAETRSYRDVAEAIDKPRAMRAVGAAQRANPFPIVVPCHRVIGSDGTLTGYVGGLETKQWLLEHEADLADLTSAHSQRPAHGARETHGKSRSGRPASRKPTRPRP